MFLSVVIVILSCLTIFVAADHGIVRDYGPEGTTGLTIHEITGINSGANYGNWTVTESDTVSGACSSMSLNSSMITRGTFACGGLTCGFIGKMGAGGHDVIALPTSTICTLLSHMALVAQYRPSSGAVFGQYDSPSSGVVQIGLGIDNGSGVILDRLEVDMPLILAGATDKIPEINSNTGQISSRAGRSEIWLETAEHLHTMIADGSELPDMIFLNDSQTAIPRSSIVMDNGKGGDGLQARCGGGFFYWRYWNNGAWGNWGNWVPVSNCLWTGLDSSGGLVGIDLGYSIAYSESLSFGGAAIDGALSIGLSFSVTQSYSRSQTNLCTIPGGNVGQLYMQAYSGYGFAVEQGVTVDGCGNSHYGTISPQNWAGLPGTNMFQAGCSVGCGNVACNAYSYWYSIWSSSPANNC